MRDACWHRSVTHVRRAESTSGFDRAATTWYRDRRWAIPLGSRSRRTKEFEMLSKSISPVSLPLSLQLSPPFEYTYAITTTTLAARRSTKMPTLRERDGRNLWLILTGAPPCVRKFSHAQSSKRFHSVPFSPCDCLRRQPHVEENPDPSCKSSSAAMRVGCRYIHYRYSERQTAREASRRKLRGWLWCAYRLSELSWWNFSPDDAAVVSLIWLILCAL